MKNPLILIKRKFWFILLLWLYGLVSTRAQNFIWDGSVKELNIGKGLSIFEDPTGKLSFQQVSDSAHHSRFVISEKPILNLGYTVSHFWLRFNLTNNGAGEPVLELAQACLPVTELYYLDDQGREVQLKASYSIPVLEKIIPSHFQVFPLPIGTREIYVRLVTNSGPIPVRIHSNFNFQIKSERQTLIYGAYLGFMLFLLLSNLFFYFSLRNGMYLFYALNVFIYACYSVVVVDGFIVYLIKNVDLLFWYTTIPTIGVTVQVLYCLLFLKVRNYDPKLYRIGIGFVVYFAIWALLKFFFSFPVVQPINTVNALVSFFLIGFIGVRVGRKGNRMGVYFAWAFFLYFLLVLTEATYINTGSPPYLWDLSYTAISTIVEAFILSFLLTKRFDWERTEIEKAKLEAQHLLVEKTRENAEIIQKQNQLLEEKVKERTALLEQEKQKSDELLHNILPDEVARELKQKGASEARLYNEVTVMFTDFVDFTGISENLSPKELVEEIHRNFTKFDSIIEKNGLEKIKTIGDAYLAVCGLPNQTADHAYRVVKSAMEIREFIANSNSKFSIRIGIHSGPVIAGIVGVKKYAFDIWGDTVNTASRMESNGEPGKVNISSNTYVLIRDRIKCVPRGKISVKGKGEVDMYFAES